MKKYLLIASIVLLGVACKTTYVTVQVLQPAQITIPSKIKNLVFINRSLPDKKDKFRNILEGAVTGEDVFADRRGSEECVKGVTGKLQGSPRFQASLPENINLRGTGTRAFPPALDWNIVEDICKNNQADALVVLETFDSNNNRQISERQAERKENNKVIKYVEFVATLNVQIEAGWRVYFPTEKRIIDQHVFTDGRNWSNTSDAKKRAEAGLPSQESAVADAGFYSGQQYAFRISPMWTNVSRYYFKKGNTDFTIADRKGKSSDWKGAAEIWRKYVNDSNSKIAGNACYNMALACEIEDDLQSALDWANKSYVNYNNKKGRSYANILQQRIYDQSKLDEQMK
jgi:hypothetical protein